MSDLPYIQQAQEVKITGQGTTGATVNYVGADSSGNMTTRDAADGTDGATAPTFTIQVGGKDGSGNLQSLLTDTSGNLAIKTLDTGGSGTLTALNTTVVATLNGYSTIVFDLTGTWVGTVLFEGQNGDSTWSTIIGTVTGQGIASAALTSNGSIAIPCGGFTQVRALMSTYVSGTVDVQYNASIGAQSTQVFNLQPTSLVGIMNIRDTASNGITSSQQTGTTVNKQALDISQVSIATGYYSAPVNIRQTATTAANATVWTMRNAAASTKTIFIERIYLMMAFDTGTPIGRATNRYDLVRFSAATPTAGTAVTVVLMDSSQSATQVTDVRFIDTGLTTTGVTFGTAFATIGCPATDATTTTYERQGIAIRLAPGEGLAIRLDVVAAIGQSLTGEIIWSER